MPRRPRRRRLPLIYWALMRLPCPANEIDQGLLRELLARGWAFVMMPASEPGKRDALIFETAKGMMLKHRLADSIHRIGGEDMLLPERRHGGSQGPYYYCGDIAISWHVSRNRKYHFRFFHRGAFINTVTFGAGEIERYARTSEDIARVAVMHAVLTGAIITARDALAWEANGRPKITENKYAEDRR